MNDTKSMINQNEKNSKYITDQYLELICRNSQIVHRTISKYGDLPLEKYLNDIEPDYSPDFQQLEDLFDVIYRYAAPLLGDTLALKASRDFCKSPVVMTANHHGVDYFAQSVQGSLLFALSKKNGTRARSTVPIFSCGNVPLDNLTYPLGLLIYQTHGEDFSAIPKKLPIFSNRLRRAMVSASPPLTENMLDRTKKRIDKLLKETKITSHFALCLKMIFDEDYNSHDVMKLSSYSRQSVVLNNRIWKKLFLDPSLIPEMVYLELEEIVRNLLVSDLLNPDSLVWCILFDPELRETVIEELDGKNACWNENYLQKRFELAKTESWEKENFKNSGTLFFWGINSSGRRIPLYLEGNSRKKMMLRGVDDRGNYWEIPFTVESIIFALNDKRLLPSVFICFLELAFARGVTCVGGYFQAEYLPVMQKGLVNALRKVNGYQGVAKFVEGVMTDTYLSGMQTVMVKVNDEELVPAGPAEIIAGGGLSENDLQKILSLSVKDAHRASLFETVPDVAPLAIKNNDWKRELAADCSGLLEGKIVVK